MPIEYSPTTNPHILTQVEWEFQSLLAYAKMDHVNSHDAEIMKKLRTSIDRKIEAITEHKTNPKMHKASLMWENDGSEECNKISCKSWQFLTSEQKMDVYRLYEKEGKL